MEPLTTAAIIAKLTDKITGGLISAGLSRLKKVVLGDPEQTALYGAVRASATKAVHAYPRIGAISAEIDLFGDEAVVEEVGRASAVASPQDWAAAKARWQALYGAPPNDLEPFLAALVDELRPRLRGNEHLRKLHAIWAIDEIAATTGEIKTTTADIKTIVVENNEQLTALADALRSLEDPAAAIRRMGPGLDGDLAKLGQILAELGAKMSSGALGKFEVTVTFGQHEAEFRLAPRTGVDAESHVHMNVPDTEEGREQLAAIRSALDRGERVELSDTTVTLTADGEALELPANMKVVAGPIVERQHATLTFVSDGLERLRFRVTLDVTVGASEIRAESPSDTSDELVVKFVVHPDGTMSGSFTGNERVRSVAAQLKANQLRKRMARGGTLELWIVEPDAYGEMTFLADTGIEGADEAVEILTLFLEVQTRLGLEVGHVEGLTRSDEEWLRRAEDLLDDREVRIPGRGQVFTVRDETNVADTMAADLPSDATRSVIWLTESEWILPLSRHPLPFGPVTFQSLVGWPPRVTREDDLYVVVFDCDPDEDIILRRGLPDAVKRSPA